MNWLILLNQKVEQLGRRQVEADTGLSRTTLSQVLNQKYPGNLDNVAAKVNTAYTDITIDCPVLGIIPVKRCHVEQIKPFSPNSPQRIRLFKACRHCQHKKGSQ
jgi:hypothetical protein